MLMLTAAITVPNVTRMSVEGFYRSPKTQTAYVYVVVHGAGALVYPYGDKIYELAITNGPCQGLRATASPVEFTDRVEVFSSTIGTGFTDAVAQYRSGAGDAGGRQNLESWMVSNGLFPAGTVA